MEWEANLVGVYDDGRQEALGAVTATTQEQMLQAAESAATSMFADPDSGPGLVQVRIDYHAVVRAPV